MELIESEFDTNFAILLHEAHHIMGFNAGAWNRFYDKAKRAFIPEDDVLIIEQSRFGNRVRFPLILEWLRTHYDCNTIDGVPLENGGANIPSLAHWDKFIVGNDLVICL